jgi:predicted ATPase
MKKLKLEKLYVSNYKSFHKAAFKFSDFNIIVGANNAGKSNFLDLLEFIDIAIRQDLITAVKLKGGFNNIKNFRSKEDKIEIKATFSHTDYFSTIQRGLPDHFSSIKGSRHTFYFKITRGNRCLTKINLSIKARVRRSSNPDESKQLKDDFKNLEFDKIFKESITIQCDIDLKRDVREIGIEEDNKHEFKRTYLHHVNSEDIGFGVGVLDESISIRNKSKEEINLEYYGLIFELLFYWGKGRDLVKGLGAGTLQIGLDEFFEQIASKIKFEGFVNGLLRQRINTYDFDVNKIRTILKTPESQVLKKNGENLHYILESLKHAVVVNKYALENISADLTGVVAELEDIEIDMQPMGTEKIPEILFKESNGFKVSRESISDGTLSLLAVLTALYSQAFLSFLQAFEEPERHLHMTAISSLMEIFRARSEEIQLFITTQSSEIMRHVYPGSDNLIFIYRDYDGFTKAISAKDIKEVNTLLQKYEYNIDEIVRDEVLGYLGDYE